MKNNYKLWIVVSLIVVFAAGVCGGILFDKHIIRKKPKKTERRSSVRFPTLETMAQELNLSSEQQEKIRELFQKNEEGFKSLRRHMGERLSSMRVQLINDIKSALNEEQTSKFEAMIEKYLSQRKREMEGRKRHPKQSRNDKGGEK